VPTTLSGITFFRYNQNQKIGKPNNLKVLGAIKPKGLKREYIYESKH
jgi:hypothetical protein